MGASPEELVEDIARHREVLGATLDEIERRMKPTAILRRNTTLLVGALAVVGGLVGWAVGGVVRGRRGG